MLPSTLYIRDYSAHQATLAVTDFPTSRITLAARRVSTSGEVSRKSKSSAVAEIGDRLATIDTGRKAGLLCPFRGEGG